MTAATRKSNQGRDCADGVGGVSIFLISRRPSATTAVPKNAPESISQAMSRSWNKSNLGVWVAMAKAPMPPMHAEAIHLAS